MVPRMRWGLLPAVQDSVTDSVPTGEGVVEGIGGWFSECLQSVVEGVGR